MANNSIPIIDLFAGPGGLGEGFSSIIDKDGNKKFKIVLSIERDEFAHETLTLRNFLRQFPKDNLPQDYYDFLKNSNQNTQNLYSKYPKQSQAANNEAWKISLGDPESHNTIDNRIKNALGKNTRNFVLIGGPPCQAYSLVGRARRQEASGLNKEDERVFLYREYYRIIAKHQPLLFIMENVKGLLSSKVDNELIFNQLIEDLRHPVQSYKKLRGKSSINEGYVHYKIYSLVVKTDDFDKDGNPQLNPKDFIVKSENYGIPQCRHRIILVGIRKDIDYIPGLLEESNCIPISKVLSGLPKIRSGVSKNENTLDVWKKAIKNVLNAKLKKEIDPRVWDLIETSVTKIQHCRLNTGSIYTEFQSDIGIYKDWFIDKNMTGVINHESRCHIAEDLQRYIFASCYSKAYGTSPKLSQFPNSLLPSHKNIILGISQNKFADRFRVQLANNPAKTITSHISKDGHYYIHPDPVQCRSLTVREAARIQTFPDNYFFCGPRTEQFHQVGNAVPPLLAQQIAQMLAMAI